MLTSIASPHGEQVVRMRVNSWRKALLCLILTGQQRSGRSEARDWVEATAWGATKNGEWVEWPGPREAWYGCGFVGPTGTRNDGIKRNADMSEEKLTILVLLVTGSGLRLIKGNA